MPKARNFIKKKTLEQMVSCEFCKISKNIFLTEHTWTTAFTNSAKENPEYQHQFVPSYILLLAVGSKKIYSFCLMLAGLKSK